MKKQLLNENWEFQKVGTDKVLKLCLPHDAMIYEKRSADAPSTDAAAFFNVGNYIYTKIIGVKAKRAFLEFDGVYKDAKVYLNDVLKKEYHYGYAPFVAELGEIKEDDIVKVECGIDAEPESRWYPGAGIYRDVNLYTSDEDQYIDVYGIKVSTLDYKKALINIKVNEAGLIEILENGNVVASANGKDCDIEIKNAKLWDAENPFLYTVKVTVGKDVVEEKFGIRQVETAPNGLFVNGVNTLLKGGCIHHDNGLLGSATYKTSEYRRVKILKEAGFNAVRSAHNPTSKHLLDACDELGMYVIDETWDMWFHKKNTKDYGGQLWRQYHNDDIVNMVNRDYNHPCVIMYSIGNEVSEPAKEEGVQAVKDMKALIRSLDNNRLVTAGFNLMIISSAAKGKGIYNEEGGRSDDSNKMSGMNSTMFNLITSMIGPGMNKSANSKQADEVCSPSLDELDVAGYNYASGRYPLDAKLHPDRLILGSETMPYTIDENWKMVEEMPTVCGDFIWTAWDYIGENGIGAWSYVKEGAGFTKPYPFWLADTGAYDIIGTPNAEAFWCSAAYQSLDRPMIALQPMNHERKVYKATWRGTNGIDSYAWQNCNGKKAVCEVFFKCAKIELFQNSKKVGTAKMKGSRAVFKIKYAPGILEAVAYDEKGIEIARNAIRSANGNLSVQVLPEQKEIALDELAYVQINITDDQGIIESNADKKVKVEVENGELLAFGSANPCTEEDIHTGEYTTYYGRALAIVKPVKAGEMKVKADQHEAVIRVK